MFSITTFFLLRVNIVCVHTVAECAAAGASSFMSIMQDKAVVKREKLCHVAGSDTCFINNLLDEKYKPLPVQDILQAARYFVGKVLSYNVATSNCEHFVTKLRYGKPVSLQVNDESVTSSKI